MTEYSKELDALFDSLHQETQKLAEEVQGTQTEEFADESHQKIAEDLYAGGEIMANGFVNAVLEKLAGSGVPAAGGGQANPIASPRSKWEQKAASLAQMHGRKTSPGDDTSVRAEQGGYPGSGHDRGKGGAHGFTNTQKSLG